MHGRVLLGIQQAGLLKTEKAGVSFKSLENSSGSWREDNVRDMVGERQEKRRKGRNEGRCGQNRMEIWWNILKAEKEGRIERKKCGQGRWGL